MAFSSRRGVLAELKKRLSKLNKLRMSSRPSDVNKKEEKLMGELQLLLRDYRENAHLPTVPTPEQIKNEILSQQLEEKDEKIMHLIRVLEEGKANEKKLRKNIASKIDDYESLLEKVQIEENNSQVALEKYTDTKRDYESQVREISALKAEIHGYKQQLKDKNGEVESLNHQLLVSEELNWRFQWELESRNLQIQKDVQLKADFDTQSKRYQEAEKELSWVKKELYDVKQQMEIEQSSFQQQMEKEQLSLQSHIERSNEEAEYFQHMLDEAREDIKTKERTMDNLKKLLAQFASDYKKWDQDEILFQREVLKLTTENDKVMKRIKVLEKT